MENQPEATMRTRMIIKSMIRVESIYISFDKKV
jgi:hypothetical protein